MCVLTCYAGVVTKHKAGSTVNTENVTYDINFPHHESAYGKVETPLRSLILTHATHTYSLAHAYFRFQALTIAAAFFVDLLWFSPQREEIHA